MSQDQTTQKSTFSTNQKCLQEALKSYLDNPETFKSYFETMESIDQWLKTEQQS